MGKSRTRAVVLAVAALVVLVTVVAPREVDLAHAADCVGSGTEEDVNTALRDGGPGAAVALCPGAVFTLGGPVRFAAPDQQLYTQGRPVDGRRAMLRVSHPDLTTAVDGDNRSGIVLSHVQVDGNRPNLGYRPGPALIQLGGGGSRQTVRNVAAAHTRSWSLLHFYEGAVTREATGDVPHCQGATVADSTFGPAGDPGGTWADGISLACGNSLVEGNTVRDATDGAIVVFGAPGSTIRGNTIVAEHRQLLGGINLVDFAPLNGNYTGVRVSGNVIDGRDAFIKVAIAMGPPVWNCAAGVNRGATVTRNTVQGRNVGYGYAVSGVRDWTVTGNVDRARHVGAVAPGCGGVNVPSAPGAFQKQDTVASVLQWEFRGANVTGVLGVSEPDILRVPRPVSGCTTVLPDEGLYPQQQVSSCDGRFRLVLQGDGNLVLYQGDTPLWAAATTHRGSAAALMQRDGNLVVYDAAGRPLWASNTGGQPGAVLKVQDDGNLVVYSAAGAPLWASNTGGR